MDAQITRLLDALEQAVGIVPLDVVTFVQELPDAGTLPIPWETWTLIGLSRHRERQYWVRNIIQNHLRGDVAALGAMGALGHPDGLKRSGTVPGMPDWEYFFHGRGCCLTHKVTGEDIDVDFWNETAEYFDIYFYTKYLESLRDPDPPEQRLLELHRSVHAIGITINQLLASGAMIPKPGSDRYPPRIVEKVLASGDMIDSFCRVWDDPSKRIWLAAMIGDWLAAHEAAEGRPDVQRITGPRADKCRSIRRDLLLQESGCAAADALFGLTDLGNADSELKGALGGPPSSIISAAMEIIGQKNDSKWCPDVYSMLKRMRPNGESPEPHLWVTALKFLLRHGYKKNEMAASLAKTDGTEIGEGVLLSLEYAPQHTLRLIRKGLHSSIPCNRTTVAAVMALIATPWSIRELLHALDTSDDQEKTADARAALLVIGSPEAEMAVSVWQEQNSHEGEPGKYLEIHGRKVGPLFSMAEHRLRDRPVLVRYEMDELHDRVMQVKHVIPPEPRNLRPWWKFWRAF
ncbi:MAG: hypothetical protein WCJ09_01850 [Planctomycetota bacterium]